MRSPEWTREELILALDLYFKLDIDRLRKLTGNSPLMVELSNTLRTIPLHDPKYRQSDSFRSPSSVHMKLMNFLRCDPRYGKSGLPNGNKLEMDIWREFSEKTEKLKSEAEAIKNNYFNKTAGKTFKLIDDNENEHINEDAVIKAVIAGLDKIINEIDKLHLSFAHNRRKAAFTEPLEESQILVNKLYQRILDANKWKVELNKIREGIITIKNDSCYTTEVTGDSDLIESDQEINSTDSIGMDKNLIKFSKKYSGITIKKSLLVFILQSIKEIDAESIYIETCNILNKISDILLKESNYKYPKHCLNNIIKFLIDAGAIVPYQDTKKGKYVIEDYEIMQDMITKPERIPKYFK